MRAIGSHIGRMLSLFRADARGSVMVMLGVALPVMAMLAIGAAEMAEVMYARNKLQAVVDAAALKGASEFGVDRSAATTERARLYADRLADPLKLRWSVQSSASMDGPTRTVTVSQSANRASFFHSLLPPGGWNLSVTAAAIHTASSPLCVLGIEQSGNPVVELGGAANLSAAQCLVQSNGGLAAGGSSTVRAGDVRSVGAAYGAISPAPITDAPALTDPFAAMSITVPAGCDSHNVPLTSGTVYLGPGVHCGSVALSGVATVVLLPGEHYFTGGTLSIGGNAQVVGSDAVVILKGFTAAEVTGNAALSLEGRRSGPYAGFALVADPSFTGTLTISATNTHKLFGTVYLPNGRLEVRGNNIKVADQSPWTVVVADSIRVFQSATLTINSNYAGSTVPVPAGVGASTVKTQIQISR